MDPQETQDCLYRDRPPRYHNKRVNYFNALKYFVNMIQETLEGDDGYIKRARSAIETSISDKGLHLF